MTITVQQLVFYFFSTLVIFAGSMVVLAKNPIRAVLFLVFTFFCMAGLWMLLESEFLSIVLVLVYVGAVMVLFLFVVMMLDIEAPKFTNSFVKWWPIGLITAGLMLWMMTTMVGNKHFGLGHIASPVAKAPDYSNVTVLGEQLYTHYLLPFELAGVILLIAMVAAISLTFRGPRETKTQKPHEQIQVRKSDRLRVLKMPSEQGDNA